MSHSHGHGLCCLSFYLDFCTAFFPTGFCQFHFEDKKGLKFKIHIGEIQKAVKLNDTIKFNGLIIFTNVFHELIGRSRQMWRPKEISLVS